MNKSKITMKNLNQYIRESILDDEEDLLSRSLYQPKDKNELIAAIKSCLKHEIYDLNCIDTSKITDMSHLFDSRGVHLSYIPLGDYSKCFDKINISEWDVSNVKYMNYMFASSEFNGDISKWNVQNVEDTSYMFCRTKFNGDISKWNVSKVEDMSGMFYDSIFNGDISKWNVSKVENMTSMFKYSKFNGDISKWNVSKVEYMDGMFEKSKFNGDISKWNVSNVEFMSYMFYGSKFRGDISKWKISKDTKTVGMLDEIKGR